MCLLPLLLEPSDPGIRREWGHISQSKWLVLIADKPLTPSLKYHSPWVTEMAQQIKAGLGTHMAGGENWLSYIVLTTPHALCGTWATLLQYIQWNIENYQPVLIIDQCRERVINILGELVQCCYSIIISKQFLYKHICVYVCARVRVCRN